MRIDEARIAIEPRTVGACIDLATVFYRNHALQLLGLTGVFGGPATLLTYWLASETDVGWLWTGIQWFFLSPFLGAAVVAGAGHWIFGDPLTVVDSLKGISRRAGSLLFLLTLSRLIIAATGVFCWTLPCLPLATRYGFLSEVVLLEQLRGSRIGRRIGELTTHMFWTLVGRRAAITFFAFAAFLSLFTLIDLGSSALLGVPILFGRVTSSFFAHEILNLLLYDPVVLATLSATAWLVYPLVRLAWFFCYLDARIRKEGWDVELAFRVEAQRLETAP